MFGNHAVIDAEQFVVGGAGTEDLVEVLPIGVGNENLAVAIVGHEAHDSLDALCIEFVENIVQEQQRSRRRNRAFEEVELCQFQRDDEGFVLSLTAFAPNGIAVDEHFEFVAMHTVERVADNAVFGSVALNHVEQRAAFAMRHIAQRNLLFSGGNLLINSLKNRY